MIIKVNNEIRTVDEISRLSDVVSSDIKSGCGSIAVAVNGKIVRKENWENTTLNDGDDIIIIRAAYGG